MFVKVKAVDHLIDVWVLFRLFAAALLGVSSFVEPLLSWRCPSSDLTLLPRRPQKISWNASLPSKGWLGWTSWDLFTRVPWLISFWLHKSRLILMSMTHLYHLSMTHLCSFCAHKSHLSLSGIFIKHSWWLCINRFVVTVTAHPTFHVNVIKINKLFNEQIIFIISNISNFKWIWGWNHGNFSKASTMEMSLKEHSGRTWHQKKKRPCTLAVLTVFDNSFNFSSVSDNAQ